MPYSPSNCSLITGCANGVMIILSQPPFFITSGDSTVYPSKVFPHLELSLSTIPVTSILRAAGARCKKLLVASPAPKINAFIFFFPPASLWNTKSPISGGFIHNIFTFNLLYCLFPKHPDIFLRCLQRHI